MTEKPGCSHSTIRDRARDPTRSHGPPWECRPRRSTSSGWRKMRTQSVPDGIPMQSVGTSVERLPSSVSGRCSHRSSTIDHRPSTIGHRPSAIGHRPSAISHRPSAIGHRPSAISHRPSAIGHRPSAIGHQPSAIGHRPSAIGHRPSAIGHADPVDYGQDMRPDARGLSRRPRREMQGARPGVPRKWAGGDAGTGLEWNETTSGAADPGLRCRTRAAATRAASGAAG
jgi:hypothetical protein